jgi:hypothetical protein
MRPLLLHSKGESHSEGETATPPGTAAEARLAKATFRAPGFFVLLTMGAWTLGCDGGGAGSVALPSAPPPSIKVTVTTTSGGLLLGNSQTFTANVANTNDTAVTWSVNSVPGGNSAVGTIAANGVYTAPADLPAPATVQVTATSHADATKSGSAVGGVERDHVSLRASAGNDHRDTTVQQPDAPLGDDDRTGLRVLYPDPADTVHTGSIQGRILPANSLSLPGSPPGVTGKFGACGGRGCRERRSDWRNPRRMELRGSGTGAIRRQL